MYSTDKDTASTKINTLIAKNQCYELLYHSESNRLYLTIKGFWKSMDAVPELLSDVRKALQLVNPAFTLLADYGAMITHPQRLNKLHVEVQRQIKEAGLARAATIVPTDRIATLQLDEIISQSQTPFSRFDSYEEADAWLDNVY
ncbi:hypothetical protein CLV24_103254 [Pontibacter ummariensis]|uniref:SpoIIAA-like n=1 Tax=Pontibacter ummariensis TaxID=1610492 RepID=A0A239CH12_9BACT|nr:hypothetical protein [Pontibacter ummariensis]PRY15015.1 hypothetical protein CLV24_103254 [Pontibacter ummariensis]SNS19477.1 hypothetical protein SAMN06296052_10359 [Pontibacter ummariensis]